MDWPPANKHRTPELLFGRIALELGFITREQLAECVTIQNSMLPPRKRIGEIMMECGYLSAEQLAEVLQVQQQNMSAYGRYGEARLQDSVMGRIIVRMGYATEEQVNEALRIQALREERGVFCRLGEIMVEKEFMTVQQVIAVLKQQRKELMLCPGCGKRYNVAGYDSRRRYRCKYCGEELVFPAELESPQADTTIFYSEDAEQ